MRIWLVTVGEPLPIAPASGRPLRAGILSQVLASRGHEVIWWTSTYDHARKCHHDLTERTVTLAPNLRLRLLHGPAYHSNVSILRLVNHVKIAREFAASAPAEPRPDIILCSLPTIELSVACTRFGKLRAVPVVLDIRDLWPDIFLELVPKTLRLLARMVLLPLFRWTREACHAATAIVGITPSFVAWGLRRAGRKRTDLDRDFPHGYSERVPAQTDVDKADRLWLERGLRDSDFVACFFGILGRQFDIDTVIDAALALSGTRPDIKFVICGTGESLPPLRARARASPNILFPGWLGYAEIWALMRRSRIGLAPYINEYSFTQSIPNKAIEYLSAGLPIVTCLKGVLSDLVDSYNCGFTYPTGNAGALAALVTRLHGDVESLEAAAASASALYRARFVAERVYAEMAGHLERISSVYANQMLATKK